MTSIRFKIVFLILILSLTSFTGFGIFIINGDRMQNIARDFSASYNESQAGECFNLFNSFLGSVQASSGISQALGENFYALKDTLSREELAGAMITEYRRAFARELSLLGGGGFFEPYAFYPNVYDFHCFVSKVLRDGGHIPSEKDVQWAADEWEWDVNTYEEGWYLSALPKGWDRSRSRDMRYYWSELYVDTSVNVLMVSVCMPIYSRTGQIVGVATVDVSLSTLQEMVTSFTLPTPSAQIAGFSTVNNATFALTGSDSYDISSYPQGSWLAELSKLSPNQNYTNANLVLNGISYTLTASVHDSGIGLAVLVPNAEKYQVAIQRTNRIVAAVICLVMSGIIIVIIIALSRWIVDPIKKASSILETLAEGDMTQDITVKGRDELAQMMRTLRQTQEGIKKLIVSIKKETATISDISNNLAANMSQTAAAANEITANVQNIKGRILNQSATVSENHSIMENLVQNLNKLDSHVGNQSSNISQATTAVEQLVANIGSVTETLVSNANNVQTLKKASEVGRNGLSEVAADIQEIVRDSEGLLEINAVMGNVASQTNLLSMNAAIEAAHAGESGKGFAVVAEEIRKLAESSSEQSKTIDTVLKKIKTSIDKITRSTEKVFNNFEAIDSSVKVVAAQEEDIRHAMEKQEVGSKQILEGVINVNEITRQVKSDSHDMYEGAKEVIHESETLEKITGEITVGMNDVADGANQINVAVKHVNEISGKNREAIDVLIEGVLAFKVE